MTNSGLEHSLCEALDAAGRDYEQAVREIGSISRDIAQGGGHEHAFMRLQQIALSTRKTEAHVAQLREDWNRMGQRPGDRLQTVLRNQESILRELIRSLDEAEHTARSVRGRVVQQLDGAARSHQMHAAYARSVQQAAE